MNIDIVTHYFHPHVGGIENVVESHAKRLATRGHDITIITSDIEAESHYQSWDNYDIRRYSAINPLEDYGVPYPIPAPVNCIRTTRSVVDENTDVVHVHGINYLTSLLPLLAILDRRIPVVLHQHTPFVDYSRLLNLIESINDRTIGRLVLRNVDQCIAVSDNIADYLADLGEDSVIILYNGVDIEHFRPDITETSNEYLYVGRLTQKKGIDRLLEAARILEERNYETTIRVVGKGDLIDDVRETANSVEILEFEGFVESKRLPELYSRAKALIVPKQASDAFPTLSILEGLASGTPPILVTDEQQSPIFVEYQNYLKSQPTAESLANTIQSLSNNQKLLDYLSYNSRITAEEHFDWDSRIDELELIYREL